MGIDSTRRFVRACRHCGAGIDLVGGEQYEAIVVTPAGAVGDPECHANAEGHEPADDRRVGLTMNAGQLAAWFALMPPDRPVIGYSTKGEWYVNIESLDFVHPDEATALVISFADDYETTQW